MEDVVPVATPLRQKVRMGTRIGCGIKGCLEMWWYRGTSWFCWLERFVCWSPFLEYASDFSLSHDSLMISSVRFFTGDSGSAWLNRLRSFSHEKSQVVQDFFHQQKLYFLCPIDGFCFTCNASESMNSLWLGPGHLLISVLVFATL